MTADDAPRGQTVTGALAARKGGEPGSEVARRPDPLRAMLDSMQGEVERQLPQHIPAEYFMRTLLTGLRKSDALARVASTRDGKASLFAAMLESARWGLMPFTDEGAIVPFGKLCTFIPMYRGLIKTMLNSGQVSAVEARLIHQHDDWDLSYGDEGKFYHRPLLKDAEGMPVPPSERGEPVLAYCYVKLRDGTRSSVVFVTKQEAVEIRDRYSKAYRQAEDKAKNAEAKGNQEWADRLRAEDPWHSDFPAQWIKSAVRRVKDAPRSALLAELLMAAARDDVNNPSATAAQLADFEVDPDTLDGDVLSDSWDQDGGATGNSGGSTTVTAGGDTVTAGGGGAGAGSTSSGATGGPGGAGFSRTQESRTMTRLFRELGLGDKDAAGVRAGIIAMLAREGVDDPPVSLTSSAELSNTQLASVVAKLRDIQDGARTENTPLDLLTSRLRDLAAAGGWEGEGK